MKWLISSLSGIFVVVAITLLLIKALSIQPEELEVSLTAKNPVEYNEPMELNRAFTTIYEVTIDKSDRYIINGKPYNNEETRVFFQHRIGKPNDEVTDVKYENNGIRRVIIYKNVYQKIVVNIDSKSKPLVGFRCVFTQCPSYILIEEFPWRPHHYGGWGGFLMPNKLLNKEFHERSSNHLGRVLRPNQKQKNG